MNTLDKVLSNVLHNEQVRRKFPRTRARFTTGQLLEDMEAKGIISLHDRSAKDLSFDDWKARRPIKLGEE